MRIGGVRLVCKYCDLSASWSHFVFGVMARHSTCLQMIRSVANTTTLYWLLLFSPLARDSYGVKYVVGSFAFYGKCLPALAK